MSRQASDCSRLPASLLQQTWCHPGAKEVILEKALDDMQFPMHPAAEKFFGDRGVKAQ